MSRTLRIATRQSELALWQANHVADLLSRRYVDLNVELLPMLTQGDRILDQPLASIGGKGLFLKELERALLSGKADLAVHSMKDVPVVSTPDLSVDIVLERANPFDALLSRNGETLEELPPGSRVGTSSLRRQCQLRALRPDLYVLDLRGNVNTRIRKMQEGEFEAIILARAGLERLGLEQLVSDTLLAPDWLPAVTQGTICLQYRENDNETRALLKPLNHPFTSVCSNMERSVSRALEGSCQLPLAVFARKQGSKLALDALIGNPDGTSILRSKRSGTETEGGIMAAEVARELLDQGAGDIISALSHD